MKYKVERVYSAQALEDLLNRMADYDLVALTHITDPALDQPDLYTAVFRQSLWIAVNGMVAHAVESSDVLP